VASEYVVVVPAYGRDYRSKREVLAAWDDGHDFQCQPSGRYVSKRDKPAHVALQVRYNKLARVLIIE